MMRNIRVTVGGKVYELTRAAVARSRTLSDALSCHEDEDVDAVNVFEMDYGFEEVVEFIRCEDEGDYVLPSDPGRAARVVEALDFWNVEHGELRTARSLREEVRALRSIMYPLILMDMPMRCTTDYLNRRSYWNKVHLNDQLNYKPLTETDEQELLFDVRHSFGNRDHLPKDAPELVASIISEQHARRSACSCGILHVWTQCIKKK